MRVEQDTGEASAEPPGRGGTVLVTGARGFVGGHLCEQLVGDGWRVRALVRGGDTSSRFGEDVVKGDILSAEGLAEAVAGVDAVVHLAGLAHVSGGKKGSEAAFFGVNVEGTRNLARAAARQKVAHFVHISSSGAMGPQLDGRPLNEETLPAPNSPYGKSKLESERVVRAISEETGMAHTILRPAVAYGPGMKGNPLRLFNFVARGWPVPVGERENRRSFLYVKNLTSAIAAVLRTRVTRGRLYVVSDPDVVSTEQFVKLIASSLGKSPAVLRIPEPLSEATRWIEAATRGIPFVGAAMRRLTQLTESLEIDSQRLRRDVGDALKWTTPAGVAETGILLAAGPLGPGN